MRSEKGVTILTLTTYVVVMTVVIAITARISTFLFNNTGDIDAVDAITQYNNFNNYFTQEVNTPNIRIIECQKNYIVFDNGVQYTFNNENKGIYRDRVKICSDVLDCVFEQGMNENGKTTIKVTLKIENDKDEYREPIVYVLK